jgi:menaquinol-cytochrome c reductase cytochrome b/c subunit
MNDAEKQKYLKRYKEKKAEGELFFPHSIAKDAIVSLLIFILLVLLAVFLGVPNEPPANPADSTYVPRPEWYFLWTFQLLKYFPGQLEGVAIVGLGVVLGVLLFGLPFFDRNPKRHWRNRPVATIVMLLIIAGMVFLTIQAVVTTPPQAEAANVGGDKQARIDAGAKIYKDNCAKCHGENGEGAELPDQKGEFTNPLNDEAFLITHTPDTLFNVVADGWESLGMPPFGLANGGALTDPDIRAVVEYVQAWYTPPEEETTTQTGGADTTVVDPNTIETVSFKQHIKPIFDKKCLSCHGARAKGGYKVTDYSSVMTSGDNAPVITQGDAANSLMVQMLHGVKTAAGGQMPPSRPLPQMQIQLIEKWINQGALDN